MAAAPLHGALPASDLRPALKSFRFEELTHGDRRLDHELPLHAVTRVGIEYKLVGTLVVIDGCRLRMDLNDADLDEADQSR
jgi:hypothetical protein